MNVNIEHIIVIIVLAWLCYWINNQINKEPMLNNVVKVLIVSVSVLLMLQSLGLFNSGTSVHLN